MANASTSVGFPEKSLQSVPGIPAVAARIFQVVERPETDAMDIARLIALDPRLTAKVLKTVNSTFYSPRTPILSVPQAVTRMGFRNVRNVVLVECMPFKNAAATDATSQALWEHQVASAVAARWIAGKKGGSLPDDAFVAGLLHDIGKNALRAIHGPKYAGVVASVEGGQESFAEAEAARWGYTHAEAGAALLGQWQMPEPMVEGVRRHHDIQASPNVPMWAAAELASRAAKAAGIGLEKRPGLEITECDGGDALRFLRADAEALVNDLPAAFKAEMELFEL